MFASLLVLTSAFRQSTRGPLNEETHVSFYKAESFGTLMTLEVTLLRSMVTPENMAAASSLDEAAVKAAFVPMCVEKLEYIKEDIEKHAVGKVSPTLGHSVATEMQVACESAIPIPDDECDEHAAQLARMIDAGHPISQPSNSSGNETNETAFLAVRRTRNTTEATIPADGDEWCGMFFDSFFAAILKEAESATASSLMSVDTGFDALLRSEMSFIKERLASHQEPDAEKYAAAAEADKTAVNATFVPMCAEKLCSMEDHIRATAVGKVTPTLGHSLATTLQMACNHIPMKEEECDEYAAQVARLVDHGHELCHVEPPVSNSTNSSNASNASLLHVQHQVKSFHFKSFLQARNDTTPTLVVPESGEVWCASFFSAFFDGILAEQEAAAA